MAARLRDTMPSRRPARSCSCTRAARHGGSASENTSSAMYIATLISSSCGTTVLGRRRGNAC
eukprot:364980-Chlamydomonas_euryale.AAC.4